MGGGEVAIGEAHFEHGLGSLTMEVEALGLFVFLVPVEAQPAEAFKDGLDAQVGVALDVGVVEAQDHGALIMTGVKPVEDEAAGRADVEVAGG